jgi:hypothetical protein
MGALQNAEIGQPLLVIIGTSPDTPNTFYLQIETCINGSCPERGFIGTSTNNAMVANVWDIGLELEGTTGASAPQTTFFHNFTGGFPFGFPLSTNGTTIIQDPVKAKWTTTPSTSPSGGSWITSCCN